MIAEFMGFIKDDENLYLINDYRLRSESEYQATYVSEMKFHISWDWLMPVVVYININTEYTFVIQAMDCYVYNVNNGKQVTQPSMNHQPSELINSVYETVVDFIEMYNQQK